MAVTFGETTTVCIERPCGVGEQSIEPTEGRPIAAGAGLRIAPAEVGSGNPGTSANWAPAASPSTARSRKSIFETPRQAIRLEVTDCAITWSIVAFTAGQPIAADFRKLTPLVLMQALRQAGNPPSTSHLEALDLDLPEAACPAITRIPSRHVRATIQETIVVGRRGAHRLHYPHRRTPRRGAARFQGHTGRGHMGVHPAGYTVVARNLTHSPAHRAEPVQPRDGLAEMTRR
ncbi:MAG: hypothetical protein R2853_11335 [Thermomicrobiales bacterium]